ncbi:MAG: hypothetical protein CMJ51_03210 [Planctomycetaceae bacterium]|nr:hypothetical protein [Planctomycetaceae bacterium]
MNSRAFAAVDRMKPRPGAREDPSFAMKEPAGLQGFAAATGAVRVPGGFHETRSGQSPRIRRGDRLLQNVQRSGIAVPT